MLNLHRVVSWAGDQVLSITGSVAQKQSDQSAHTYIPLKNKVSGKLYVQNCEKVSTPHDPWFSSL